MVEYLPKFEDYQLKTVIGMVTNLQPHFTPSQFSINTIYNCYTFLCLAKNIIEYRSVSIPGNGCANLAKVWLAEHLPSGSPVAVKTMKLDNTIDLNLLQVSSH